MSEASFVNRLPVVLYLSLISVVGFVGNSVVLLVYWRRFKPCATRAFVLAMALCDMITNTLALPLQIVTVRYAYDIDSYWLCRSFFATSTLSTQASGCLLAAVAVDRYRRICRPFKKQLNASKGLAVAVGTVCFSLVLFAPFVPLYGIHRINTPKPGIQARICWIEDEYKDTAYPLAYTAVVSFVFFLGLFTMVMSYVFIGVRIWRQKWRRRNPSVRGKTKEHVEHGLHVVETVDVATQPKSKSDTLRSRLTTSPEFNFSGERYVEHGGEVTALPEARAGKEETTSGWSDSDSYGETEINSKDSQDCAEDATSFSPGTDVSETDTQRSPENFSVAACRQPTDSHMIQQMTAGQADTPRKRPPDQIQTHSHGGGDDNAGGPEPERGCQPSTDAPRSVRIPTLSSSATPQKKRATVEREKRPRRKRLFGSTRTRRVRSRTTLMMSVLTIFYIFNWLPHLIMRSIRRDPVNWCDNFTECGWNMYAIVIRSIYLNSAVNAFVYSFCNARFRQECRGFFHELASKLRCHSGFRADV